MKNILFKKVKCKGYVAKCNKYIHNDSGKETEFEEGFKQDLKQIKKLNFEGFCVGITKQAMSIWLVEYDHPYCPPHIVAEKQDYIYVARVYYANNKSRLVPIELIENIGGNYDG